MFSVYPWAPLIYLATGVCILLLSFFQRPTESSIAILSVLTGVPAYIYFKRKYSRYKHLQFLVVALHPSGTVASGTQSLAGI